MSTVVRPRRSVLFMPGSNARAMEKTKTLAADALIFDLEDAVASDAKAAARQQVHDTVCAGGYGQRELIVRVNALTTPWGRDDLTAVAACGPDAVLAPKVESADSVRQVLALLAGQGVVLVDGQLIENLHVENAQRIVRIAEAISAMASA